MSLGQRVLVIHQGLTTPTTSQERRRCGMAMSTTKCLPISLPTEDKPAVIVAADRARTARAPDVKKWRAGVRALHMKAQARPLLFLCLFLKIRYNISTPSLLPCKEVIKVRKMIALFMAAIGVTAFLSVASVSAAPTAQANGGQLVEIDWYRACADQGGRDPHPGWGPDTLCWGWQGEFVASPFNYCDRNLRSGAVLAGDNRWYCDCWPPDWQQGWNQQWDWQQPGFRVDVNVGW